MRRLLMALLALTFPATVGTIIFVSAGRWDLPMVWGVLGVLTAFILVTAATADPGMLRERRAPGPGNRDRLTRPLSAGLLLVHWIVAGLDVGRFQWSVVPLPIQIAGLIGYAVSIAFLIWTMRVNPFYSSVVRIQHDRGHHLVAAGPYRFVRHPGYTATMFGALCGGLALGSWLAMIPGLIFVVLFVRRTLLEDRLLQQELAGYAEYAQKVRYRLVVWVF